MSENIKENVSRRSIWLRLVFMIVLCVALGRIADGTFEAPDQVRGIGSARAGLTPAEFADQLKPTRNFA